MDNNDLLGSSVPVLASKRILRDKLGSLAALLQLLLVELSNGWRAAALHSRCWQRAVWVLQPALKTEQKSLGIPYLHLRTPRPCLRLEQETVAALW
jgi:hypothetical protein